MWSSMSGAGLGSAGLTPFGYGTPTETDGPSVAPWGSRFINPATKDLEFDATTGQLRQMPPVRQRVLLTVLQTRGSSTTRPNEGIKRPVKMGDGFAREQEQFVRDAHRQMTDVERVIRIDQVTVTRRDSQGAHTDIAFTDLTTGVEDKAEI